MGGGLGTVVGEGAVIGGITVDEGGGGGAAGTAAGTAAGIRVEALVGRLGPGGVAVEAGRGQAGEEEVGQGSGCSRGDVWSVGGRGRVWVRAGERDTSAGTATP